MNRRSFLTVSLPLAATPLLAQNATAPDVTKLDPALAAAKATAKISNWHSVEDFGVEGREWLDMPRLRYYDRLPSDARKRFQMLRYQHAARAVYFCLRASREEKSCETAISRRAACARRVLFCFLLPLLSRIYIETFIEAARDDHNLPERLPKPSRK